MSMDNQEHIHWTEDPELLARYALDHVEETQRRLLDEHLASCFECRDAVRKERELAAGIRLSGRERLKARLRERVKLEEPNFLRRYQLVSLAAAVIVIFIALGFFRFYFGSFEWPSKFSSRKYILSQSMPDSGKAAGEEARLSKPEADREAESVQPSPPLDNLAARGSAGAEGRTETGLSDLKSVERDFAAAENEKAFWLLGTITVIHDAAGDVQQPAALSIGQAEEASKAKSIEKKYQTQGHAFTIRKAGASQTITLSQRPSRDLPESRLSKSGGEIAHFVQTLVERTSKGLNITMYLDAPTGMSNIQQATVEPVTEDSLVVTLGNERIAYRIPGGWGSPQSTKTDIEGR
jgi:hypothetical protein